MSIRIKPEENGLRLIEVFSVRFPFHPVTFWKERIQAGYIKNPERPHDETVKCGDVIEHHIPRKVEPSVPDEIYVLEESAEWMAFFKPAPMPVHAGGRYYKNSMEYILHEQGYTNLLSVHRLDAVTSGIMLFAKSKAAARNIQESWTKPGTQKVYLAQVSGNVDWKERIVNEPIRRKKGFVFQTHPLGKPAQTRFINLGNNAQKSLIECRLSSGRTHQIRLHLKTLGHPIIDDPVYGMNGNEGQPQNTAISLMHCRLSIPDLNIDIALELNSIFAA